MPDKEIEKSKIATGVVAAVAAVSVTLGGLFDSPADLVHSDEVMFPPAVTQVVHTEAKDAKPEEPDSEDESGEKEEERDTFAGRLRELILRVPRPVRAAVGVPLWAAGHVVDSLAAGLWTLVLSPALGHVVRWLLFSLLLLAAIALTLKLLFPNIPWRKLLNVKTVIAVLIFTALCEVADWILPSVWENYRKITNWVRAGGSLLLTTSVILTVRKKLKKLADALPHIKERCIANG